ncbi:MAG: DUF86 domain-containing protein [Planctomycetes bacterium]|nr:DUF86 domain-containing protein [Planctomycetota bacterium]
MTLDQIQGKVDVVTRNLEWLAGIPHSSYEEFVGDYRNVQTALHLLQTAIQALIDIASYLIARLGLRSPATSTEILDVLHEAGKIRAEERVRFRPMFAFRNRVVHLYDRIDDRTVYEILVGGLEDLRSLLGILLRLRESAG